MSEFADQAEPSGSGYGLSLLVLALGLGVLTIRMKHQQQMEQTVEVTKDFTTFQATFMSEHASLRCCNMAETLSTVEQEQSRGSFWFVCTVYAS